MLKQNLLSLSHNSLRTSPVFRMFLRRLEARILAALALMAVFGGLYMSVDNITHSIAAIKLIPIEDSNQGKVGVK